MNKLKQRLWNKRYLIQNQQQRQTIPDIQSAVENPAISEAQTTAKGDLVIEITKNSSWISVKDQNRKVLAQKEYKQGEDLNL